MNLKFLIQFVFCFLLSTTVFAQEKWTLEQCVAYALEHNLQLKNMEYGRDADKESYRQSIRDLLPSLSASSDYTINYGRSEDPNTNDIITSDFFSNRYALNASMDIFKGFQKLNNIKATKFLYQAALADVDQQKYLLTFKVMQVFFDIKFYEGLVKNAEEQVKISQTNFNLVSKQIELGLKAGADAYEAEAALLTDQLLVTQNKNLLQAAKLSLIQEMNLENTDDIVLVDTLDLAIENQHEVNADSVYAIAKDFVPVLKAEQLRAKAAKKSLAVARGKLYPSISIYSGYNTGYFETNVDGQGMLIPFKNQFNDNASRYIGAQISIPISDGWSIRSGVKQQKIALLTSKNKVKIQEQELFKLIQQKVQEHNALEVELRQSDKKMEAQQQAFKIAQKKYEKELFNIIELLQAKNLFANAQNENLQVKLKYQVNKKTLDFYGGLPLFNSN